MEKALEMGKTSVTGSFHLLIGVATSTVIMAIGTIILTRLMSPAEYGLYSVALIPSLTITLFRDMGVNTAMTRYIANLKAANKPTEVRDVIFAGLIFEIAVGLALSLLSIFLATFITSTIFHRPESTLLVSISSATILSGSVIAAVQASFVGSERMKLNSLTIICQAIVKTIIGPVLVILAYGVLGAIIGYTLSFVAAGAFGLAILYFALIKPLRKTATRTSNISKTMKTLLVYGIPVSIASVLGGILGQFYGFLMASSNSDLIIGNYQAAVNFSVLLTFFTVPIGTVLFPAFAKLDPQNDRELLRTVFTSSVKFTSILLVPATIAMIILSGPMVSTLFGERYAFAPFFLSLSVIGNLSAALGSVSVGSFLVAIGETRRLMKQSALTLLIGVPLGFVLIPMFGVTGVILGSLFSGLPSMFWALYWIWKHYQTKADLISSAKILSASGLAAFIAYASVNIVSLAEWIRLTIGVTVFLAGYISIAPLIGAITKNDIASLRAMFSNLGIVSRVLNIPLIVVEKIAVLRTKFSFH